MTTEWSDYITTGKQANWPKYTLFYHVTPKSRIPSILANGLGIPFEEQVELSKLAGVGIPIPGIYLNEDKEMILFAIAGIAMVKEFGKPLSLLKVWVKDDMKWVDDPDGPPGSIVVLDPIPPELVWIEEEEITEEMIPEEP